MKRQTRWPQVIVTKLYLIGRGLTGRDSGIMVGHAKDTLFSTEIFLK